MNGGEDEKAKKALQVLVDKGTAEGSIYANLAKLQLKGGDTTAALSTIMSGKDMNEADKTLINMELDIYLKQGPSKELIEKLNGAIADDPDNTIYYFARAISYEGLGENDKAAADYDKILEIDPEYYDASYNKGVMYLNRVAEIVEELDGVYKPSIIEKSEAEINIEYKKAIVEFENVFNNNDDMKLTDKVELAGTMKKIYARLEQMEKSNEMKAFIDNGGVFNSDINKISVGDSEKEVLNEMGIPQSTNVTKTERGSTKQFVYEKGFIYIDVNGKVSAVQL